MSIQSELNNMLDTTAAWEKREVVRRPSMTEKIVLIDGQAGCGKTMLSPIVASLDRVELLTFPFGIEHMCAMRYLQKIEDDAARSMIRMITDLQLYRNMMSREINFRPTDLSSVFRDVDPIRYIKRLFLKGDEYVPERVKKEKPILHLATHNLLSFSEPFFSGVGDRLTYIEVVRHPLYMLKQQALNMQRLISDVRHFAIYFDYKGYDLPFYAAGWEDQFIASNDVEKSILTDDIS